MIQTILLKILAAFIGTYAFAALFEVVRRHRVHCGLTGAIGYAIYIILLTFTDSIPLSSCVAAVGLTICARTLSARLYAPTTVFLISGIFALVPGARVYYMSYGIFRSDIDEAVFQGMMALKISIAIAFGIALVYLIPSKIFGWGRDNTKEIPNDLEDLSEI